MTELRPIDKKRITQAGDLGATAPAYDDIGFTYTVFAQCFLPYRDPRTLDWDRKNGAYSISLVSGKIEDPATGEMKWAGLPFGAKPRLFQSYICTQAIKQKSPVIPVEHSMTGMLKELGFEARGGKRGTINSFKDQITRFARCNYTLIGPGPKNGRRYVNAPPIKTMDVWFPSDPNQKTLWPSEIVLSDDYYYSLKDHAIPFDFRGLRAIQNKPRAQDIYLWMTQRLCRISDKPLLMRWPELYEMFGGGSATIKVFKQKFAKDLAAAFSAYPDAIIQEHKEGYLFKSSPPPIPKIHIVKK